MKKICIAVALTLNGLALNAFTYAEDHGIDRNYLEDSPRKIQKTQDQPVQEFACVSRGADYLSCMGDDVMRTILSHIDSPQDLAKLSAVCKSVRASVFAQTTKMNFARLGFSEQSTETIQPHHRKQRELPISRAEFRTIYTIPAKSLQTFLNHFSGLRKLNLYYLKSVNDLNLGFLSQSPFFEKLGFACGHLEEVLKTLPFLPRLHTLKIFGCHIKDAMNDGFFTNLPSLSTLNMSEIKKPLSSEWTLQLDRIPQLKTLILRRYDARHNLKASEIRNISQKCPQLEHLDLAYQQKTEINFMYIIQGLKSLRTLNLKSCYLVDQNLMGIETLTNLTALNLDFNNVGDASIICAMKLPSLHHFSYYGNKVSDRGGYAVLDHPGLQSVVFDRTPDNTLTPPVRQALRNRFGDDVFEGSDSEDFESESESESETAPFTVSLRSSRDDSGGVPE